ncbi:MAG: hypothetical protein QM734_08700 [Cyclobacteriaceae bacterium]
MFFSELSKITDGKMLQLKSDKSIESLVIDSRKALIGEGSIFLRSQEPETMVINTLKSYIGWGLISL